LETSKIFIRGYFAISSYKARNIRETKQHGSGGWNLLEIINIFLAKQEQILYYYNAGSCAVLPLIDKQQQRRVFAGFSALPRWGRG
jgi:hypothetical protein